LQVDPNAPTGPSLRVRFPLWRRRKTLERVGRTLRGPIHLAMEYRRVIVDKVPSEETEMVRYDNFEPKEVGAVSKTTHGSALEWPWFESSLPPYNHVWCPDC
jgi:hypothetical protein